MVVIIDTCVILDALRERKPYYKDARRIFLACAEGKFKGYITAKSVTDIYYLYHKDTHSDKTTREIISRLLKIFRVCDICGLDCKMAIFNEAKDFEDALMIETAARVGAECIVTRNIKDYSCSKVPAYSPKEFIDILNIDTGIII